MLRVGIVLLAAGASSRMGQPKQLLPFDGSTLLRHAIANACASRAADVALVLGGNANVVEEANRSISQFSKLHVILNESWVEGLSSSIQSGLRSLKERHPGLDGVLIMTCDQPFVSTAVLDELMLKFESLEYLVLACSYAETFGIPALFHESLFPDLLELRGDGGAKKVIERYKEHAYFVEFPDGQVDIDTPDDYAKLKG